MKRTVPPEKVTAVRGHSNAKHKASSRVELGSTQSLLSESIPELEGTDHRMARSQNAIAFALQQSDDKIRKLKAGISHSFEQVILCFNYYFIDGL